MKEKIFRNFSLKILSALCAIVLWTIIVNIYDPTMGVTISTVPVQLINTESLTDKGYTYEITDGSKISVYVSGPKSVITDIKAADIVATADLSRITAFADYADIDVKVVKDGKTLTNVEVTPKTTAVKLDIENRVTQQFDVGMEVNGTEAEGYVVTKQTVSPSTILLHPAQNPKAVRSAAETRNIFPYFFTIVIINPPLSLVSQSGINVFTICDFSSMYCKIDEGIRRIDVPPPVLEFIPK